MHYKFTEKEGKEHKPWQRNNKCNMPEVQKKSNKRQKWKLRN